LLMLVTRSPTASKGYGKRLLLHHLSPCSSLILLSVLAMPMNSVVDLSA
jgi:hypothetical protein